MISRFPVPILRNRYVVEGRLHTKDPIAMLLYDRLLWLRNHYDVGSPEVKADVLKDIDETLAYAERI